MLSSLNKDIIIIIIKFALKGMVFFVRHLMNMMAKIMLYITGVWGAKKCLMLKES